MEGKVNFQYITSMRTKQTLSYSVCVQSNLNGMCDSQEKWSQVCGNILPAWKVSQLGKSTFKIAIHKTVKWLS
jgi:hypothetical protein